MATATLPLNKTRTGVLYPHAQWYFLLAMGTTWLGFAQSYFAVIRTEPLLHHIHGALMGGWIALLVAQPILYQRGNMRLHRTLGRWGAFLLVPAIVIVGFLMVRRMLVTMAAPPSMVDQLAFLDINSLVYFPLFVGLAIYYGKDIHLHARYIVCTVLLIMPPAVARALPILPMFRGSFKTDVNVAEGLMSLILLVLIGDDVRRGKVRAAYPVALLASLAGTVAANFVKHWGWWHALTVLMGRSA